MIKEYFTGLKNSFSDYTLWEKIWIPLSTAVVAATCVVTWNNPEFNGGFPVMNTVASVSGMICVALVSGRKISNWLWGLINVVSFAYLYWRWEIYGYMALNLVFYLPVQFIGFVMWLKRKEGADNVAVRPITKKTWIFLISSTILCLVILTPILMKINGGSDIQAFFDANGTTFGFFGQLLMNWCSPFQWIYWCIEDAAMVVLNFSNKNIPMGTMYIMWLINAAIGLFVWLKNMRQA